MNIFMPLRAARRESRRFQRAGISPLQPSPPPYPSEVAAAQFSPRQLVKVAELVARATARAGGEAKKESARLKMLIAEREAEIRRINLVLNEV